MGYAVPV